MRMIVEDVRSRIERKGRSGSVPIPPFFVRPEFPLLENALCFAAPTSSSWNCGWQS